MERTPREMAGLRGDVEGPPAAAIGCAGLRPPRRQVHRDRQVSPQRGDMQRLLSWPMWSGCTRPRPCTFLATYSSSSGS